MKIYLIATAFVSMSCQAVFSADQFILMSVPHVPAARGVRSVPSVDCEALAHILGDAFGVKEDHFTVLDKCFFKPGKQETHERCTSSSKAILRALRSLVETTSPGDHVLIYFSGHGTKRRVEKPKPDEPDGCDELLVACDFQPETFNGGILDDDIDAILQELGDRQVVVILDACFSGSATKAIGPGWILDRVAMPMIQSKFLSQGHPCDSEVKQAGADVQYVALLSSSENEPSFWLPSDGKWKSLFTRFLVKGLSGDADEDGDAVITYQELIDFLSDKLDERQTPRLMCPPKLKGAPILGNNKPILRPSIEERRGYEVRITRGSDHGVEKGDIYDVWRNGRRVEDAAIKITSVSDRGAKGIFFRDGDIRSGDMLSLSPVSAARTGNKVWLFSRQRADEVRRAIKPTLTSIEGVRLVPNDQPMDADLLIEVSPANDAWVCEIFETDSMMPVSFIRTYALKDMGPALVERFKGQRIADRLSKLRRASRRPRIRFEIDGGQRPFFTSHEKLKQDKIRFVVTGLVDSYVTLISVDKTGYVSNGLTPKPIYVRAGERRLIKPANHGHYVIEPPAGRDLVFAIASGRNSSDVDILKHLIDPSHSDEISHWSVSEIVIDSVINAKGR